MCPVSLRQPSKLTKFTLNLILNLPLNPTKLKRHYSDSNNSPTPPPKPPAPPDKAGCNKKTYETPHPPKDPPDNYCPKKFCHDAFTPPEMLPLSIFRQFSSPKEELGPCAHKCQTYKNPEYFSYHRFSFTGMQLQTLEIAKEQASLRCIYDYESGTEDDNSSGSSSSSSSSSSSDDSDVDCKRELR